MSDESSSKEDCLSQKFFLPNNLMEDLLTPSNLPSTPTSTTSASSLGSSSGMLFSWSPMSGSSAQSSAPNSAMMQNLKELFRIRSQESGALLEPLADEPFPVLPIGSNLGRTQFESPCGEENLMNLWSTLRDGVTQPTGAFPQRSREPEYLRQMSAPSSLRDPFRNSLEDPFVSGRYSRSPVMPLTPSPGPRESSVVPSLTPPPAPRETPMVVKYKFGQQGDHFGMFHSPHGFCLGTNEEIYVADTYNHRIQIFTLAGVFLSQFGEAGKELGQLYYPRKMAVLNSGNLVICDRGGERSRMQIFSQHGHFLRRIQIRFIDIVAGLVVSSDGLIVAVDSVTPTVFFLSEEGDLVKYFDCSEFMSEPSDIQRFNQEYYICDFKGHKVVVIDELTGQLQRVIGSPTVTPFPNGIDISDDGDVLVGDSHGNQFHVAVFDNRGRVSAQFTCPTVKVSRCCGLKITRNGCIVTLAKNNHHVLVLDTLYVN